MNEPKVEATKSGDPSRSSSDSSSDEEETPVTRKEATTVAMNGESSSSSDSNSKTDNSSSSNSLSGKEKIHRPQKRRKLPQSRRKSHPRPLNPATTKTKLSASQHLSVPIKKL